MTHLDWNAALLDEPDDGLVRLAFADWLEEHGEGDRAAWVRLSAVVAESLPRWRFRAAEAPRGIDADADRAFERCWPAGWRIVAGAPREPDRGLVRFVPQYGDAITRLGATGWFPDARAAGWLAPVDVSRCGQPPDRLPGLVASLGGVPLSAAPDRWSPGSPAWMDVRPTLHTLTLGTADVSPELGDHLGACPRLRVLTLVSTVGRWNPVRPDVLAAAVRAARAVPGLRRLDLIHWWAEGDGGLAAAVLALAGHPTLRRLTVYQCRNFRSATLDEFRAAAPHVALDWTE